MTIGPFNGISGTQPASCGNHQHDWYYSLLIQQINNGGHDARMLVSSIPVPASLNPSLNLAIHEWLKAYEVSDVTQSDLDKCKNLEIMIIKEAKKALAA